MTAQDLAYLLTFETSWEAGDGHPCHRCGSELTARQADGRWGCPWCFTGPVQLELAVAARSTHPQEAAPRGG